MLGAIDPIIVFQIYKNLPPATPETSAIPLVSLARLRSTIAVIPIYLSEEKTGVFIDTESKNIDIDTNTDSLSSGDGTNVNQKALGSITTVNLFAKKDSIGLTVLLALSEQILDKVTSQEYEVTYMNGAVTVFGGLIHAFSYEQGREDDLYKIKIEFARGRTKTKSVQVAEDPNAVRLGTVGTTPGISAPTTAGAAGGIPNGQSVIKPGALP